MTFGLIGCGRISTNHILAACNNHLSISGVCDIIPERMELLLSKHNLNHDSSIRRYTDYRRMLDECRPELAAICTESGNHASIALDCIDAGCNLIIEKPIALSLKDADEIIKRAQQKNVLVCACHQNRFNPSIQYIRGALEEGRFGKLSHGCVHVRWSRQQNYYTQASWRGTWAQDGGALMNQSIHGIDLLRWMMGDGIEEVFAYTARQFHPYLECEDVGLAVIKFKNGALGTVEGTTNVFPKNLEESLYLFGENGTVKAGGTSANTIDVWQFTDEHPEDALLKNGLQEQISNVYGNGHIALYADMIDAIQSKRPPYVDALAGKRALELVLAIYKSAATGKPVTLPLGDYSTVEAGRTNSFC